MFKALTPMCVCRSSVWEQPCQRMGIHGWLTAPLGRDATKLPMHPTPSLPVKEAWKRALTQLIHAGTIVWELRLLKPWTPVFLLLRPASLCAVLLQPEMMGTGYMPAAFHTLFLRTVHTLLLRTENTRMLYHLCCHMGITDAILSGAMCLTCVWSLVVWLTN